MRSRLVFEGRSWAPAIAGVAVFLVAMSPGLAHAGVDRRPDLTVSSGSVALVGGKLTGSFAVRNKGIAGTGDFSAALVVRVSGKGRLVKRFKLHSLGPNASRTVRVAVGAPPGLPAGSFPIRVCADDRHRVAEHSERNDCRTVGMLVVGAATSGPKNGTTTPAAPASSVPKSPIPFTKGAPFTLNSPESEYWVFVPNSYDGCRRRQGGDLLGTERRSGEGAGDDR